MLHFAQDVDFLNPAIDSMKVRTPGCMLPQQYVFTASSSAGINRRLELAVLRVKLSHPLLRGCPDVMKLCKHGALQESANVFWKRLPPPVQQVAPYVGAAGLSALIVHRIGSAKLRAEVGSRHCIHVWL